MFRNPLTDVIVVLVIVLLFFGPKRLPALGQGLREFKDSITGGSDDEAPDEAKRPELTSAAAPSGAPQSQPAERQASEPRS
ncbi:MAG TPA: twin-arginine translocase TatA/TatE family subunit [Solirubrobacteraceae bacterium]|nr:twin-arginine translocase TatA/TatE family subunit [Solirubrobacteraceae bacterium]